ncbi:DMT family transporter [uncultured Gemella sp.]|uniref:DMT family transporter n=1 Tax=uncultured Gemella sp. TaxID=254352 RepID=UPI0028D65384|nr:DMT family transporter [uncultured Gemella sp.]
MKNKVGISAGLLSGMFWGLGLAISACIFSLYNISPFAVAVIHDFISIFVLLAIILVKYKTINLKIFTNIKSVSVIVGALLAGPIGMQCNLYAVKYIGSGLTSSITAIYPAVSVILAVIFLKNKVSSKTLLGIALIIVGIFIQSYKSEQVESFYLGFMFALICAVAWGSESVLSSYAMKNNLNELETLLIRQVTSFLAYLVIISFNGLGIETSLDVKFGGLIVFFVVSNMVSYILYYMAINKLEPAKATGLNVSYVVWTILFSMIFVALEVNLQLVVTSIIIILGVYVIVREE